MFNPLGLLILTLLMTGAAYWRRERAGLVAAGGVLLLLILLLASRLLAAPASNHAFPWAWTIGEENWWPSAALLLLALVALIANVRGSGSPGSGWRLLLVAGAALAAAWADSPAALVTTWALLGAVLWLVQRGAGAAPARQSLFWLAPLALWLAAAVYPPAATALRLRALSAPSLTQALWLLAAMVAIGAFPLHFWRTTPSGNRRELDTMMALAPAAAGAVLLSIVAGGAAATTYALPLTLAGMLGLLWAAYQAWSQRQYPPSLAMALVLGEASLLMLLAVWGGPEAVLAQTRVLLLGAGLLLLATGVGEQSPWQRLALIPSLAALAAFPLTAGFAGRGALYSAWLASENWLLLLVAVLLQAPLLAAAVALVWPQTWPPGRPVLPALAPLLAVLGLISWQALGEIAPLVWAAIALQIVGALALFRYASQVEELEQALQEALALNLDGRPAAAALREVSRTVGGAIRDATRMLEGEAGLLWVLFFLVVIWLAR
jgi:hypothetical protein